jgi:transposase
VGYVCGCHQQPLSQQHMGTAVRTAKTSPASWDAFSDIEAFVDEVLTELAAMAGTRPTRPGPKPPLMGAALRKAIMAIWCVGFCGVQWRAIGQLCDIPFSTLYTLFARWTRLGLWRRLLNRLILTWRQACGDKPVPSAVIIDSRSCCSAPTFFAAILNLHERIENKLFLDRTRKDSSFKRPHIYATLFQIEKCWSPALPPWLFVVVTKVMVLPTHW